MRLTDENEDLAWQLNQNVSDLESAKVELSLAEMELAKYVKGTYPKELGEAEAKVAKAETSLETEREDLQTSLALFSRGFVTAKKVKQDRQKVADAERELASARIALEVLSEYEHPMEKREKEERLRQAKTKVERTIDRGRNAEINCRTQVARAQDRVNELTGRLEWKQEQFADCTVTAPRGRPGRLPRRRPQPDRRGA